MAEHSPFPSVHVWSMGQLTLPQASQRVEQEHAESQVTLLHAPPPASSHVTWQAPLEHSTSWHAASPLQPSTQLVEAVQVTLWQAATPVHVTEQSWPPHLTSRHELFTRQSTVQVPVTAVQVTSAHALFELQLTVQSVAALHGVHVVPTV